MIAFPREKLNIVVLQANVLNKMKTLVIARERRMLNTVVIVKRFIRENVEHQQKIVLIVGNQDILVEIVNSDLQVQ